MTNKSYTQQNLNCIETQFSQTVSDNSHFFMDRNFKLGFGIFLLLFSIVPFSYVNYQQNLTPSNCSTQEGVLTNISELRKGRVGLELLNDDQDYVISSGYTKHVNWDDFRSYMIPGNRIEITYLNSRGLVNFSSDKSVVGLKFRDNNVLTLDDISNDMDHLYEQNLTIGLFLSIGGILLIINSIGTKYR